MSIMIDLPPAMAQEAQGYATIRGTTLEQMLFEYIKSELEKFRAADKVRDYLMRQDGWLPKDYVFNRDEANS